MGGTSRKNRSYPLNEIYAIEYRKVNGCKRNHIWKIKETFLDKAKARIALTQYGNPRLSFGGWETQYRIMVYTRNEDIQP